MHIAEVGIWHRFRTKSIYSYVNDGTIQDTELVVDEFHENYSVNLVMDNVSVTNGDLYY